MTRRLYRSRTDTILGGVAAGLANYLNTDPALVRIAWAVLVLITNGVMLLAYIVAWVVVPEEPEPVADTTGDDPSHPDAAAVASAGAVGETPAPAERRESRAGVVVGAGLVLLGVWFLLREYLPPIDWGLVWPIILIGIGAMILVTSSRRRTDA